MPTSGSRHFQQSQKLKDTCDMCSASKIRCDKKKPMCGRCEKLGYPCFYSPARRVGRPHPPQGTPSPNNIGVAVGLPEGEPMSQARDEGAEPESNTSSSETQISLEHDTNENLIHMYRGSENNVSNDRVLDFRGFTVSQNGHMKCPQTDHYVLEGSSGTGYKDNVEDAAMFNFEDRVNSSTSIQVDRSYCQAIPSDCTSTLFPNTSNHSCSTSSTFDQMPGNSAHDEGSDTSEYDCVMIATSMLHNLNMTSMNRPSNPGREDQLEASNLDDPFNTISMAIKRVSTILVCPCSQKQDVGLLAAAVCAAILDIYGIILREPKRSRVHTSTDRQTSTAMSLVNDMVEDANTAGSGTRTSQDGPNEKVTMMRVLEELPKVAHLVLQFAKRYTHDAEECAADFLPALAASLTCRLKSITDKATAWLA